MKNVLEGRINSAWKIWIGVSVALTTIYFVVEKSATSKLVLYNGVGLLSIALVLLGLRVNKPETLQPWLWFAGGLVSFLTADVIYYVLELRAGEAGPPFPSIADPFYLAMYPLMIIGLTKLVRAVAPGRSRASLIDGVVVAVAMFGIIWVLFVDDVVLVEQSFWSLAVSLAYPVVDVALLAVAARLLVTVRLSHPPFALIVVAIAALAIADMAYQIALNSESGFSTGTWIDAFWLTFYIGFAVAALHPALARPTPQHSDEDRLTTIQLVIMFFATLSVPLIDLFWGNAEDRTVTIAASAALFLMILVRIYDLMKTVEMGKDRLRHDAEHDSLTGLANRVRFAERTEAALANTDKKHPVAVLFIDLDDFKTVNDSLGHQAGDQLLAEVANRLEGVVRDGDTVARFGGDEFAVLLESAVDRRDAMNVARRALDALGEPIEIGDRDVRALASIGIAMDLEGASDVDTMMRNADVAMYLSKSRGKGRFEFFEDAMHEEAVERLDLKVDLQRALDEDEFLLHYQPIFNLKTGKVDLVEALIRWKHPDRGLVSPDKFISLAEENGLIVPIGNWVIHEACKQAAAWQQIEGCEDISVSINLSMRQLQDDQLIHALTSAIAATGVTATNLVLEITESMLAIDAEKSVGLLGQLKTIGVKLAIDDFGTGYSSLSYLKAFPVDAIKIDRSFINELHRSSTSSALVEAVVNLSTALGAYTVAEGIEYSDQADILRRLGCDLGQGFYYCRPLPGGALTQLFQDHLDDELEPLEAWRRSAEEIQERNFDSEVRMGLSEIRAVAKDIDALADDLNMPVMARTPWLTHWAEAFTNWTPMVVEIRTPQTQQLAGCAMLAIDKRAEVATVVALGHSSSLFAGLPARDATAAKALARAIVKALDNAAEVWSLDLEQLPDHDPTLGYLKEELDNGQLLPELRVPRVLFSTAHNVDEILSKSKRKQLRRARQKINNAGLEMVIAFDRGRAISSELLDEVETVHVQRDRDARRNSDLDRPAEREFWRRVVEGGHDEWEVEIATLRLDGHLAAYAVAILDGDTYRIYDGRMATEWQDYSPGRLVEAASLSRALSDQRFSVLDWMSGIAAEKLLTTNFAESRARLVATSGSRGVKPKTAKTKVTAEV
ncbi:MAG: diguanylate cyclase (GGDEF)-like protein [Verrucomicrobiales bacterium]|jgi:diguanylate cyclase (GGDEF)-like protein